MTTTKRSVITVLCVDDHPLVLDGIMQKINRQPDMTVVATATNGRQAVDLFKRHRPDVTVMDLQLPGMSGLDAIQAIRSENPKARIVVLTMYQGDEDIFRALKSGAATYLLKDTPSDELVRAVREVHLGLSSLPANVAQRLGTRPFDEGLTARGMEVLRLLAAGMRNKEIAAALDISQETVQGHVKKILRTLEVNDRTAAVTVAIRRGIIRLE
jgi:two-component system NarL family response regulator